MTELDTEIRDADRLTTLWRYSSDTAHRLFLINIAYPFDSTSPVEFAKNALTNLQDYEFQQVMDWMAEQHWLPPGM